MLITDKGNLEGKRLEINPKREEKAKQHQPTGGRLESVSYTHLDVYKRQGLNMAFNVVYTNKYTNNLEVGLL